MKKLLTLLLVAAMAVASFGVLTACGDKSGGGDGNETTTSSTLEGEWYYKADMLYPDPSINLKVPQEITIAIAKLADDDKTGEFEGMDYAAIVAQKTYASALSDAEKAIIAAPPEGLPDDVFVPKFDDYVASDGNVYGFMDFFAFEEKEDGDYSAVFADINEITKVVYKDNKLNVTMLGMDDRPDEPLNVDFKYRALGANPDISGTWTGFWYNDPDDPVAFETDNERAIFVGRYAYVDVTDLLSDYEPDYAVWCNFMFMVGNDMYYCTVTSLPTKVTKKETAAA